MAQGHVRRRGGQPSQRLGESGGILLRESALGRGCERRRADPVPAVALCREPLEQPLGSLFHAPVLGEPARELLGRLLRLQRLELGRLVREQAARLQLQERRDEDEELAAGIEIDLVALGQALEEGEDDRGDVDLARLERVLQEQRQEKVERPFEGVEIELELSHEGRLHTRRLATGPDGYTAGAVTTKGEEMLGDYPVHVVLLSLDLAATRRFYNEQLGLEILDENEEAITFRCGGGSAIAVTKSTVGTADEQTQAGWFVPDLSHELAELRSRGVEIQEYDLPGLKTENGVADLGFALAAWVVDPHGNALAILELKG